MTNSKFDTWIDTFLLEKEIDPGQGLNVTVGDEFHMLQVQNVIDLMKLSSKEEKIIIMKELIKIDFYNKSVVDYLEHLVRCFVSSHPKVFSRS